MVVQSGITMEWRPLPSIMAKDFDTLGVEISNFKVPLDRSISKVMVPSIKKNFAVGGRPAWQPLTNTTLALKASRGHSQRILHATNKLSRRAGAIDMWVVQGQRGIAAMKAPPSPIEYGIFHLTGWQPAASGPLSSDLFVEARPWAMIQQEDANDIEEIFFEWIEERIDIDIKAGRRSGF